MKISFRDIKHLFVMTEVSDAFESNIYGANILDQEESITPAAPSNDVSFHPSDVCFCFLQLYVSYFSVDKWIVKGREIASVLY